MTDKKGPTMAQDGYSKSRSLTEGFVRKGGSNSAVSQIQTRPAPPAPMKPSTAQGPNATKPAQSGDTKQSR